MSTSFIPPLTTRYVSNCRLAPELHANIEACLVSFICYQYSYQQFFVCKWLLLIPDILKVSDNEMYSLDDLCNTRSGALGPALRFCPPFFKAIINFSLIPVFEILSPRSIISQGLAHVKGCHLCQVQFVICSSAMFKCANHCNSR